MLGNIIEGDGYSLVIAKSHSLREPISSTFGGVPNRINLDNTVGQSGLTPIPPIVEFYGRSFRELTFKKNKVSA
jgi:hypothetical protein